MNFQFADPWLLALLLLLPLLGWAYRNWNLRRRRTIRYSDLDTLAAVNGRWARIKSHLPFALRIFALALLVVALARPRSGVTFEDVTSEGVDIVLTMDVSTSMLAEDLNPGSNRLDVAREVVGAFIGRRRHDRIGLVVFAAQGYTQCPLPTLLPAARPLSITGCWPRRWNAWRSVRSRTGPRSEWPWPAASTACATVRPAAG